MKKKPSDVDNDFDITIGVSGERILVSDFSIKGDGGIIFVSVCTSDSEVKGVS